MIRPLVWQGHQPTRFNATIETRATQSERGQFLGTSIVREGFQANYEVRNLPELWVRDVMQEFLWSAWRYAYFVAHRPIDFPDEVDFVKTSTPIVPENATGGATPRGSATKVSGRRMDVSWSGRAIGGHISGIFPWGVE